MGMIAYSIYKQNKIEALGEISKDKKSVSDSDLQEFNNLSNTDSQVDMYRNQAEKLMADYSEILLSSKLKEIEAHYRKRSILNFAAGVWQSILGSFFYSLIIALVIVILWAANIGLKELIVKIFSS